MSLETPDNTRKRGRDDTDEPLPSTKQRNVANQMNKQRRAILEQWEATEMDKCWLVVWYAFREKGNIPHFPAPQLSHEWTNLRRWARNFIKAHSNVTGNPYNVIYDAHEDDILGVIHYLDDSENAIWPLSTIAAPLTIPEIAQCIAALAPRIDRFASIP